MLLRFRLLLHTWLATLYVVGVKCDIGDLGVDFRSISYESLVPVMHRYADPDAEFGHFDEILFDFQRYQLLVGGRDAIYRFSLDGLTRLERAVWTSTSANIGLCTAKGQSEENCRNFVKILVSHEDQLFACGTNAFNPKCSWREIEDINKVVRWIDGRGKCPHSPLSNSSALMTESGDYYIASSTDFSDNDHAIYRMSGNKFGNLLRTAQYNTMWLAQPSFVGSFETEDFIYFLFRETATEYINCGKAIYSRIARVCKNDKGGTHILKDNWTTFLKARLNCSLPGEYPFYYNEIQSMFYLEKEKMVYATFTTGENSISGSAVCSFQMDSIESAFSGPFKYQSDPDSTWEPAEGDHDHFECKKDSNPDLAVNSRKYQLVNNGVKSSTEYPLFKENLQRYSHIVVESVVTKHLDTHPVHVIFLATSEGVIKKLSFDTRSRKSACLVEILHPFARGRKVTISNMKLLQSTNSIYLTTEESVLQISTHRCQRFQNKQECLGAMDPYCGWDRQRGSCTQAPNNNPRAAYFLQDPLTCPLLTNPVNGGWGKWSSWSQCDLEMTQDSSKSDACQCKRRNCDSPSPQNGGAECLGNDIEVTNCTQHGKWTDWSEWSSCSKTCDIGVRQRRRTCGNPAPAFGGSVCIGTDVDSKFCSDLPPCDDSTSSSYVSRSQYDSDRWSEWSQWSQCSSDCGKGFQTRDRICYSSKCSNGCAKEYKECDQNECTEMSKLTNWTPWVRSNSTYSGDYYERRFSFTYMAPITLNEIAKVKEEERFCRGENQCSSASSVTRNEETVNEQQPVWTEWSQCTRKCGGGSQLRLRDCPKNDHSCNGQGMVVIERSCNVQPCQGQWSCWSEWSTCDSSAKKRRHRQCESQESSSSVACERGAGYEEIGCDGWGLWGQWGDCDNGYQTRYRSCKANQCNGDDRQSRTCGEQNLIVTKSEDSATGSIVMGTFSGFFLGLILGGALIYYFLIHRKSGINGSPHYVSAKSQNLYVSLPMLDLKHKHFSSSSNQSDCGTLRSTTTAGTLRSKASVNSVYSNKPSDYDTATIKRSHSQRNSSLINGGTIRADLDSDQLFR